MHLYVPFYFFKVPLNFAVVPKAAFCKFKAHRGTPKGGKCQFFFSLIIRHFFMHFYLPFHFSKVSFAFACLPKALFRKAKAHRGTPKEAKMPLLFFSLIEWHFFIHFFTCLFIFLKFLSLLPAFQKQHFARIKRIGVPQKKEKVQFFFSLIERHFFMHFYVPFYLFKVPFDFVCLPKAAFCSDKAHRGTPKGGKISVLFYSNRMVFFHVFLRAISFV